jgi:DNA mismatch endonuclease (patch repair protein)
MGDIVDSKTRSRIMSAIGGKNTKPEVALRRFLHRQGFRFRLHKKNLPGRPDLVLAKYRAAVFVHGCFWHRHMNCSNAVLPMTNQEFWLTKLTANQRRDIEHVAALQARGWRVAIFWECAARKGRADERSLKAIARWITQKSSYKEFPAQLESKRPAPKSH